MSTHNQNGILQRYLIVCKHVGAETFFSSIEIPDSAGSFYPISSQHMSLCIIV